MTDTMTRPQPTTTDGDSGHVAHYAKASDVARAYVTGEEITALCGKRWVPSRDPKGLPICSTCKSLAANHQGRVEIL